MTSPFSTSSFSPEATLRERVFALHCQGLRSPAISEQLGVPERTIRAWLRSTLDRMADEAEGQRQQQLALAVAAQQSIASAAWEAFTRAAALEAQIVQAHQRELRRAELSDDPRQSYPPEDSPNFDAFWDSAPQPPAPAPAPRAPAPPRLPMAGARYLSLALTAQREIARLRGLFHYVPEPVEEGPTQLHIRSVYDEPTSLPEKELDAWRVFRAAYLAVLSPESAGPERDKGDIEEVETYNRHERERVARINAERQARRAARERKAQEWDRKAEQWDESERRAAAADEPRDPEAVPGSAPAASGDEGAAISTSPLAMPSASSETPSPDDALPASEPVSGPSAAADDDADVADDPAKVEIPAESAMAYSGPDTLLRSVLDKLAAGALPPPKRPAWVDYVLNGSRGALDDASARPPDDD